MEEMRYLMSNGRNYFFKLREKEYVGSEEGKEYVGLEIILLSRFLTNTRILQLKIKQSMSNKHDYLFFLPICSTEQKNHCLFLPPLPIYSSFEFLIFIPSFF